LDIHRAPHFTLLIAGVLFLLLPTILKKSKQFMAARETSAEAA
jgi:hypothetical protein